MEDIDGVACVVYDFQYKYLLLECLQEDRIICGINFRSIFSKKTSFVQDVASINCRYEYTLSEYSCY